ncbi:MAG: LON peptidase substrate-binding domain-containing protein, partial [Sphingomonadales bacterium]|nr:LON peptidase substrate-binding domain-containing protein [Sphingomonadales bacterium]
MRDFRDAKVMAQSLRGALADKQTALTHSEALELVARMLGVADWNTLSAFINKDQGGASEVKRHGDILPVVPVKDMAPFPDTQMPLWIRRPHTIEALNQAFSMQRRIVLVAQKSEKVEEPGERDVYDIGVIARVLDVGPPSADLIAKAPTLEGAKQVLLQTLGRVRVRHFSGRAGRYQAEVEPIEEGAIQGSPERIEDIATRFKAYAEAHNLKVLDSWPPL